MTADESFFPTVSVVIPTYNSARTLRDCLLSIKEQNYPREIVQIIIADGGSTDSTIEIARATANVKVVTNRLRTGEAGKALGASLAENEILAFVDSDNILDSPLWLHKMTRPFSDQSIVASEPLYFSWRKTDTFVTRYCALIGANDPLTVYLGNHDRFCFLKEAWTEIPLKQKDCGDYIEIELHGKVLPTFGANGFLVRRRAIRDIGSKFFLFDVDLVHSLASAGGFCIAKVKVGIAHLFASGVEQFSKKSVRRIRDYSFYSRLGARSYPWREYPRPKFLKFVLFSLTVVPTLRDARRGYQVVPDRAWLFHPLACFLVLWIYAVVIMTNPRYALRTVVGAK